MIRSIVGLMSVAVQTSLAMEAEREHRRLAQRVGAVTAAFNRARSPEGAARTLLRGVELLTGLQHAYVVLFNPTRLKEATVLLTRALQVDGKELKAGMNPTEHPIEQEILRTREPVTGERYRAMLDHPAVDPPVGVHGLAAIPVHDGPLVDGVLNLWTPHAPGSPEFREVSEADLATIRSLCGQTAVALERTRLQQLAQQTAHEQRVLAQIAARLSAASDHATMGTAVLHELSAILPLECGRLTRCSGDEAWPDIVAVHGDTDGSLHELAPSLTIIERWVRDARERWVGPLGQWLPPGSISSSLGEHHVACWPILLDDATVGSLSLIRKAPETFLAHEQALIDHAVSQLALGLRRASSHQEALTARDEAEHHIASIKRMLRISNEMTRRQDLDGLVETMEIGLGTLIPHEAHALHRADRGRGRLDLIHGITRDDELVVPVEVEFGAPVIGDAARLKGVQQGTVGQRAVLSVPMVIEGDLLGTVTLWRDAGDPFGGDDASLLGIFAAHAASELQRTELTTQRRELHLGGIRALVSAVDTRDPFTRGHSARVGRLSRLIASEMQLPASDIEQIEVAGLLHDVGKIGIPDAILQKPAPLDDHERAVMMGHADLGAKILQEAQTPALEELVPHIRHHHEWWDGRGYPAGLRGHEIPIGAQIIGIADAWDTMTNDRPYRSRLSPDDAWRVLDEANGAQFAPAVVEALGRLRAADELAIVPHIWAGELTAHRHAAVTPVGNASLGDLRSLGILVDLARFTSYLSDPRTLLQEVTTLLAERLDMSVALILDPGTDPARALEAVAWSDHGFENLECRTPDVVDRLLANDLPGSLSDPRDLPEVMALSHIFTAPLNTGVVGLVHDRLPKGAILFMPSQEDHHWRLDLPVIEAVAPHVLAVINIARLHERAREDALTDGLTGAANYRGFYRTLSEQIDFSNPFSLLMFDVVGLKQLNDTVGHLAGDELLRQVVNLLRDELPDTASIARIGGDEFGVIMPDDDPQALGERVKMAIRDRIAPMYAHTVAIRFGWAIRPEDGGTTAALVHTADQRMYQFGQLPQRS